MKRVVVFFPSWRYFGHFALPLFEPLAERFEIVFFHTEKAIYGWDDCPDLSDKGIETIDLKTLKTFSFVSALRLLRADCVVVFDKGWTQDRALLHAAKHLALPSLHIQHGSTAILDNVKTHHMFQRAIMECVKIMRTFGLYNRTLMDVGFREWISSFRYQKYLLLNPNDYYYNQRDEIVADRVCLIGASERDFFTQKDGYQQEQLVPLGNLECEAAYKLALKNSKEGDSQRILLLSQPLFEDKYLPGGMEAKLDCVRGIVHAASALEGVSVAVKPHPREDSEWYKQNFSDAGLFVYPRGFDLNQSIIDSSHVIGFFSTALLNAMILNKPVGIIRWMGDHGYAPNFDDDGAAMSLRDASDLVPFVTDYINDFDTSWYAYDTNVECVLESTVVELIHSCSGEAARV